MLLSGQILEFRDERVEKVVRVVDDRGRLIYGWIYRLVLELQRERRQLSEAEIEEHVDGDRIDHLAERNDAYGTALIDY